MQQQQIETISTTMNAMLQTINQVVQSTQETNKAMHDISQTLQTMEIKHNSVTLINNGTVILNSFGNEDTSHISPEKAHELLLQGETGLLEFFRLVYFSEDKPQNKNFRIKSKKQNRAEIWKDNKWSSFAISIANSMLYKNITRLFLHRYFTDSAYRDKIFAMAESPTDQHVFNFVQQAGYEHTKLGKKIKNMMKVAILVDYETRVSCT
jgi:hypothetical protein